GEGVIFNLEIALDEKYMFTAVASAKNAKGEPVNLQTYAYLNRIYDPKAHPSAGIVHEGPIGVFDGILKEVAYSKFKDEKSKEQPFEAKSGWLGITDKYWLAAIIPNGEFAAKFSNYRSGEREHFRVEYIDNNQSDNKLRLFVGAKEMAILDSYSAQYNIPLFDHAVDLGMFDFLTKPILKLMTYIYGLIGNFGIVILILTVIVKIAMYPLANKSYRSMEQMKKLTPKMNDIRERHKEDKLKMNQEIMELYKREKVNPASGCLPMVVQIPVFFALYRVLSVALEMRHAPFFGWIHDLSAPDSTNIFTAFGLLDWNTPSFLHLGIFPIIMCVTMIIQQRQSPPPPDPTQAQMMRYMPFMMLFLFSSFAVGLVIYWSWSNVLSILQQWHIKRKYAGTHPAK
ncbi:MAG: membrane protein insertase YidC, partial [Pseudomonadota bacterium]